MKLKISALMVITLALTVLTGIPKNTAEQFSQNIQALAVSNGGENGDGIIHIDRNRSKADITELARELTHSGFIPGKTTQYDREPSLKTPYIAGMINSGELSDALNVIKMIRYIAGLPYENITLDPELNAISQHGAVLLAASGQFTHDPQKPADMSGEFFSMAYLGCSSANLYKGSASISSAILGFMTDPGAANIAAAAHRRWILRPSAESFGVGCAGNVVSMYVLGAAGQKSGQADTYIAWPSSGDFPIEYFTGTENLSAVPPYPWSVNLGVMYRVPSRDTVTVTLTRTRDGKSWYFDKNTPQLGVGNMPDSSMHFSVDNTGYGIGKAIIFRPDTVSLGPILPGDEFTVEISGLETDAGAARLCYTIRFFSLIAELEKNPDDNSSQTGGFLDISNHWSRENIEFVTERGLFLGTGGGFFTPDGTMTRAMFVTVLARLSGTDMTLYSGISAFSDVDKAAWYAEAVAWAAENGIINGVGNGRFSPGAPVTRAEMAAVLFRYASYYGVTLVSIEPHVQFLDDSAISEWCIDAVYTLRRAGIVKGKPGNLFDPGGFSTRAEVAAILRGFIEWG